MLGEQKGVFHAQAGGGQVGGELGLLDELCRGLLPAGAELVSDLLGAAFFLEELAADLDGASFRFRRAPRVGNYGFDYRRVLDQQLLVEGDQLEQVPVVSYRGEAGDRCGRRSRLEDNSFGDRAGKGGRSEKMLKYRWSGGSRPDRGLEDVARLVTERLACIVAEFGILSLHQADEQFEQLGLRQRQQPARGGYHRGAGRRSIEDGLYDRIVRARLGAHRKTGENI